MFGGCDWKADRSDSCCRWRLAQRIAESIHGGGVREARNCRTGGGDGVGECFDSSARGGGNWVVGRASECGRKIGGDEDFRTEGVGSCGLGGSARTVWTLARRMRLILYAEIAGKKAQRKCKII